MNIRREKVLRAITLNNIASTNWTQFSGQFLNICCIFLPSQGPMTKSIWVESKVKNMQGQGPLMLCLRWLWEIWTFCFAREKPDMTWGESPKAFWSTILLSWLTRQPIQPDITLKLWIGYRLFMLRVLLAHALGVSVFVHRVGGW